MVRVVTARGKYACSCEQDGVVIADVPDSPVDKGLACAGLLAHVVVCKYEDHLPLHRLEGIFARLGVHISRSTMADWIERKAVERLVGDHGKDLAASSTKSMTGHLLGAAGAIESIFSGSVVVDEDNSSGFGAAGTAPLVAIYTSAYESAHPTLAGRQAQSLAYSTDGGYTWTKYAGNPVLDRGSSNFR